MSLNSKFSVIQKIQAFEKLKVFIFTKYNRYFFHLQIWNLLKPMAVNIFKQKLLEMYFLIIQVGFDEKTEISNFGGFYRLLKIAIL